jgi:hypothetical protein
MIFSCPIGRSSFSCNMRDSSFRYAFSSSFTRYPGGRLRVHGPFSGELFRDDVLMPLLDRHDVVTIDLTGVRGFGSSFLDEAFAEAGKRLGRSEAKRRLLFECADDPALLMMIAAKIEKAIATV